MDLTFLNEYCHNSKTAQLFLADRHYVVIGYEQHREDLREYFTTHREAVEYAKHWIKK